MSLTIKVNGVMNSLVHKGSDHFSMATIPDVCKTPSPGGPVPLPYPNVSLSNSLAKGTTTVKADGGNMIAIKGSEFSMSQGDEPGTAGGVKSSTFKKESTWIIYSFDVKMEGKNACRLTDKKFQNHENTVDMMGTGGFPKEVLDNFATALCRFLKECTEREDAGNPTAEEKCNGPASDPQYSSYREERGAQVDKCVKKKINDVKRRSTSDLSKEVKTGQWVKVRELGGNCDPDVVVGTPPNCDAVYDIKTSCPPRSPESGPPDWLTYGSKRGRGIRETKNKSWHGKTQAEVYQKACGVEPTMIHANSPECQ